jgi:hypothetical protein
MKTVCTLALAAGALLAVSAASAQDDTTTTTTSTTVTPPQHGAYIGVPGVAGVEVGGRPGCVTRSKTETDQDTGQSRSMTESNCP